MVIDYTKASKTYDNTRAGDDVIIDIMAENNVLTENKKILDFGCGTGNYLYKCQC